MTHTIETLENGVRIVHVPVRGNPAVTVMALVGTGSEYERELEAGISHFLEHMVFKGTRKRPKSIDISRELDQMGASYNAATSREYTAYYVRSARIHLDRVTAILADLVRHPALREQDIERERGVVLEELNMYRDLPQERVAELFAHTLYGDQPAGRDIIGTRETIRSFSKKEFNSYQKRHYTAEKTVVVVAGGVSREKAVDVGRAHFGSMKTGKGLKKRALRSHKPHSRAVVEHKKTDQSHVVLGGRAYHRYHKDMWPFVVLQAVLDGGMSSRIFQRVREDMGAAYYAGFGVSDQINYGTWAFSAGVTTSRVEEVLRAVRAEFEDVRLNLVSDEELKKTKDHLIGSLLLALETSTALARFYGFQVLFDEDPIYTPGDIRERIQRISAEEVREVARKYLDPSNHYLAVVGPHKKQQAFERILK